MTEIERKALELVNEFRAATRNPPFADWSQVHLGATAKSLLRAIEQHEAFRREVSEAVEEIAKAWGTADPAWGYLRRFIIAKPDPLVEVCREIGLAPYRPDELRAAIEKRGGKIVWGEG